MDSLVSLTVIVRTVFFRYGECRVVTDQLQALYPWLVLDCIKDFVDRKPQRSEVLFHLEGLEWIQCKEWERLSFVGRLSQIRVTNIGWSFIPWLWLLSFITAFERQVGDAPHLFLQLDIRLGSGWTSLIRVTSCFSRSLYRGWEFCNLLMNASAETFLPQLGTLTS